jgi:hypothetical protein
MQRFDFIAVGMRIGHTTCNPLSDITCSAIVWNADKRTDKRWNQFRTANQIKSFMGPGLNRASSRRHDSTEHLNQKLTIKSREYVGNRREGTNTPRFS